MAAEVGDPAPDFTLPGVAGDARRDYSLSEYRGRKVVLAFYPGDFTPGCTKQLCQYRDQFSEFEGVEAVLLEVRADNDAASRLYDRAGFEVISVRRRYYQPGDVDALVMRLLLTKGDA